MQNDFNVIINKILICTLGLCAISCAIAGEAVFPEFNEISPEVKLAPNPKITVDKDGNWVVNGKIRYLLGVQVQEGYAADDVVPTSGYPDSLKWIYEHNLSYESAQRLGFDTISVFASLRNFKEMNPGLKIPILHDRNLKSMDKVRNCGLPIYVDYTQFPWDAGMIASRAEMKHLLPSEAVNQYRDSENNHWVAYNIFHPKAREIYNSCWRSGAEEMRKLNPDAALMYELFNEPAYDDPSTYNRKLFAGYLAEIYRTPEAMNKVWRSSYPSFEAASSFKVKSENPGLAVDWGKFLEDGFADLCKDGIKAIRAVDPGARFSIQSLGFNYYRALPKTNVNVFKINKFTDNICVSTGGGLSGNGIDAPADKAIDTPANVPELGEGILQRHFYRSLADGKPIHNGETYIGKNYNTTFNTIWLDLLRGSNATYIFVWAKRAFEWKDEAGGKKNAEKYPYMLLNPYCYPSADLKSIMDAKKEIFKLQEFFVPRNRNIDRNVALLLSYPTERYAAGTGYSAKNQITNYTSALEFSHYPIDVILEEQLPEGRANSYKAIVAAGVRNIYPQTVEKFKQYVRDGGVLILANEFMPQDEYGNPVDWGGWFDFKTAAAENSSLTPMQLKLKNPAVLPGEIKGRPVKQLTDTGKWEILGEIKSEPALLRRQFGKGYVYLVNAEMQDYAIAAVAGAVLQSHNIKPVASIVRAKEKDLATNIEVHAARRDDKLAYFLYNWDNYPKLIYLKPNIEHAKNAVNLAEDKTLPYSDEFGAMLLIPPRGRTIIGFGFTDAKGAVSEEELKSACNKIQAELADQREAARRQKFSFKPNPTLTAPLDLRKFCNRNFVDDVAGDGIGGWTDQGRENSLVGVPWGVSKFVGVPAEIIRYDQNDNRTCIVMKSTSQRGDLPTEVKDIPVNAKIRALYFFHATARFKEKETVMNYVINYASGKKIKIPVVCGENIWDWWIGGNTKNSLIAWMNMEKRGFYIWQWKNPEPADEIRSVDIVSANTDIVPIVIAITAEQYDGKPELTAQSIKISKPEIIGFGNLKVESSGGTITASVSEKTGQWAGINIHDREFKTFSLTPEMLKSASIKFKINGGLDRFNNHLGDQKIQFAPCKFSSGMKIERPEWVNLENFIDGRKVDNDPETFQEVVIPLKSINSKIPLNDFINGYMFQFRGTGGTSGVTIKDLELEILTNAAMQTDNGINNK